MSEFAYRAQLPPSVWSNNPVFVQMLGLSPLLALSNSMVTGIAIGIASSLVLVLSSIVISLSQRLTNATWRFAYYLFVLAIFTSAVDFVLQWQFPALHRELGIYLPLICCNLALLSHVENRASKSDWPRALGDSCVSALATTFAITMFSALREGLGTGSILVNWQHLIPMSLQQHTLPWTMSPSLFEFVSLAPGAMILLGLLMALKNILNGDRRENKQFEADDLPVQRARVTGKI